VAGEGAFHLGYSARTCTTDCRGFSPVRNLGVFRRHAKHLSVGYIAGWFGGARGEGSSRWGYCSAPHWVPMIQPNPACVDPSCPLPWPPQTRPTQRPILSVEGVCGSQPRVTEIKARGQALTPKPRHPPPRPPLLGCSPAIHLHGTGCSLLAVPIGASRGFRGKGPGHILHPLTLSDNPPSTHIATNQSPEQSHPTRLRP